MYEKGVKLEVIKEDNFIGGIPFPVGTILEIVKPLGKIPYSAELGVRIEGWNGGHTLSNIIDTKDGWWVFPEEIELYTTLLNTKPKWRI